VSRPPDSPEVARDDVVVAGSRVRITHGGEPTDEQLAALTVVLTAVAHQAAPPAPAQPPAWAQAALLEGIGARIVEEPAHLRSLHAVS
jgi:hypothetical protein